MEKSMKNNAAIFLNLPLAFYFLFPNISVKKCHCSRLPGSCLKVCVWVGDSVLNQSQCNPNLAKVRLGCLSDRGLIFENFI